MHRKNNVHFIDTLSSAEAFLCCGEAGETEKESAGNYTFYFSIIANFIGIPSGSLCGGESYRHLKN